jgi:TIR domain
VETLDNSGGYVGVLKLTPGFEGQAVKDFFISYSSADRGWAEWIGWQLEEAGYSVVIRTRDFEPGQDFTTEMNRALREAEQTLAVLTPKYLESQFMKDEWTAAFAQRNLLPVRAAEFSVEGLLNAHVYIDLVGKGEAEARETLLAGVKRERGGPSLAWSVHPPNASHRAVAERPPFPGALPVWNAPDAASSRRPFGLCAGEFIVPDDFDAPLPDEVLADFEER